MLLIQKGREQVESRNSGIKIKKNVQTAISETPEHPAKNDNEDLIAPDDVPGGIGKFFQTTMVKPSPQKAKKPPLPKLQKVSKARKVNERKKSPEEHT